MCAAGGLARFLARIARKPYAYALEHEFSRLVFDVEHGAIEVLSKEQARGRVSNAAPHGHETREGRAVRTRESCGVEMLRVVITGRGVSM